MNCQPKEMMRLEFLLSLGFSGVQESQAFHRMNQRSLSQCSGLSITTFKIGTPGEKPQPNKNSLNSKKNVFMKSELPWGSDILAPALPLWVMMWPFPKKSVFWFSVKSILWQRWPLPITGMWCWCSAAWEPPEHLSSRYKSLDPSWLLPQGNLQHWGTLLAV